MSDLHCILHPPPRFERRLHLSVPHLGEAEAGYVQEAFASNWLSTVGPNLDALEAQFERLVGRPAVALVNGTSALHLACKLLSLRPGDEVVTPTLTFAASCNPIRYEGGRPVFVDSEPGSWNLDPNRLADFLSARAAVNRLPKAVIVVHLFGQSADLDAILGLCNRYELPLLEDAAESLGARYRGGHPGSFGAVGVFSFNGNKMITGTSGGMLVAERKDWVEKARYWSTQARDVDPLGIKNYVHSQLGYNYRFSNVLAGIVRGQLEVLDLRVRQRRAVFERYRAAFEDLEGIAPQEEIRFDGAPSARLPVDRSARPAEGGGVRLGAPEGAAGAGWASGDGAAGRDLSCHSRWLSCFLIDEAKFGMSTAALIHYLEAANIEARPVWRPMHTQPLYQGYESVGGEVAEDLNRRGMCLPSSSSLTVEDQQFVIDRVREAHMAAQGRREACAA